MNRYIFKIDKIIVFLYFLIVLAGIVSLYSVDYGTNNSFLNSIFEKQIYFFCISIFFAIIIFGIEKRFLEKKSHILYLLSIFLLLGLFFFGTTLSGATSWYNFGGISFQPSEFAKLATALYLSKSLSFFDMNLKTIKGKFNGIIIIILPVILILLQPDPGSALVFATFIFPLLRAGLHSSYFLGILFFILVFVSSLLFPVKNVMIGSSVFLFTLYFFSVFGKNKKKAFLMFLLNIIVTFLFIFSTNYIFNEVFEQRHRDRFNIILGKKIDKRGAGYNTDQSKIAIGSGGLLGKGYLQGTQTKGNFVPEQATDYIFSNIGEEWGFLGSLSLIILFSFFIIRIIYIAEKQKNKFNLYFGYCLASIIFGHFAINIGTAIGVFPTVGIPLPFISYGGSNFLTLTIFISIFLKLNRR